MIDIEFDVEGKVERHMAEGLDRRGFVVGCMRSGTTLLESRLAAHHAIKGFPESKIFLGIIGQIASRTLDPSEVPLLRKVRHPLTKVRLGLGVPDKVSARWHGRKFFDVIGRAELYADFPDNSNSIATQVDAFIAILDKLTVEEGKEFWIEKSPAHLYYVDAIEQYVKPAKIVHIVRSGPDVVASLYDASKWDQWTYFNNSLDKCINAWNLAIPVTIQNMGKPNHLAVSYEQLVEDTEHVLRRLCEFLEVEYDPGMMTNYGDAAKSVAGGEPWKERTSGAIYNANSKFQTLFTPEQQSYVRERLIKVDTSQFYIR